ncbi:MAG TPA: hypothetical protein PKE17_19465 [Saprospiraceae bacterium]|nr:hypothetical protein [Saprospiraceae bacterium]
MAKHRNLGLFASLVILAAAIIYHRFSLDGLDGALFSSGMEYDTQFATQYSDQKFRAITAGMTTNELIEILGNPLVIWTRDKVFTKEGTRDEHIRDQDITYIWKYSISPSDTHYHMRTISVKNGIVVGKHSEFYVD